ncbi:MAG: hypothetical protein E3J72_06885 [Planctomycetota bacterium]|nr:MAG: hypothetical protein E3J72_06885 [Planctomycetota bacterium]
MEKEQIIRLHEWLQGRITLDEGADAVKVMFNEPAAEDFKKEGFGEEAVNLTLKSDWWAEMVTDVIETPDFAEPDETPEQILQYARDLVVEYIRKRLYT